MAYLKLKILLVAILMSAFSLAEGGEEQKPKSEGINRGQLEYSNKESRMNSLESKMREAQKRFDEKLGQKKRTTDTARQKELAKELFNIAKERNSFVSEYNDLRQELLYKYPNKGQEIDKRFIPRKHKSVAEMENTSDFDRQLTKAKDEIKEKYKALMPPEEREEVPPPPSKDQTPEPKKKLRLEK